MMRPSNDLASVYLCLDPVDFRKQINGLAALVADVLRLDPFAEQLFVFTNRRRDRIKILYWEASGFVLWMKRLERERFHWPRGEGATITLSGQQLNWLLDGFDLARWRPHRRLRYDTVS
ncbi:MAG: IS66 family insertion sequence element accessory protein TnpB [Enhydrobacter sp.]|nr:IS66 family insertion sequence element accessory protein TnpB [Enhydrobacter sp.]